MPPRMIMQAQLSKLNAAKVRKSVRKVGGIVGTVDHMDDAIERARLAREAAEKEASAAIERARLVREAEKKANDASERARLVRKAETQASALCPCERRTLAF